MRTSIFLMTALFFCVAAVPSSAQPKSKLKVFVDCSDTYCDMSYFRTQINVIDFYRDRLLSDMHVLITSNSNASQGRSYQMIYYGQNGLKGKTDTVKFSTPPNATDFERRDIMLRNFKIGLLPWLAKNQSTSGISINMKLSEEELQDDSPAETEDRWNYWVYRVSGSGNLGVDKIYKNTRLRWNASASQVTGEQRITFYYYGGYNLSSYEYEGDNGLEKVVVQNENQGVFHLYAKALSAHWAVGYEGSFRNETFSNYKYRITLSPGIEYSIFPYDEFNNRFFTLRYSVGMYTAQYLEPTIYEKTSETLPISNFEANLSLNQKWGNVGMGLRYSSFLHNLSFNNLNLRSDISVRITGGLSFNVEVQGGLVHDQLNLPVGEATEEEVLTRRRQLKSTYNARFEFGLSYRFGSKLNNFVNPIFDD